MEYPSSMVEKANSIVAVDTLLLDPFEAELQLLFGRETPVQNENENRTIANVPEQDLDFEMNLEKRILSDLNSPNKNEDDGKETTSTKNETIEGPEKEDKFEQLRMLIKNKSEARLSEDRHAVQETEANQNTEQDEKEINTPTSTICLSTATSTKINADEIVVIPSTCTDDRKKEEISEVTRELENFECNQDTYFDLSSSPSLISSASESMSKHTKKSSENKIIHTPTSSDSKFITPPPAQIIFEQNSDQHEDSLVSCTSSPIEILFVPNSDQNQKESEDVCAAISQR